MSATATIETWIAAFNAKDVRGAMALYAEEASLHVVFAEPVVGKDAIGALFEQYFAAGDLHCNVVKLHVTEDGWVILEWKDAMGLPGCNIYRVEEGQIREQRNYFDQLTFFRKMGIPIPKE